ncbi:uncharacterized protein B0I36DRAFT_146973 [Microdochium trichocladiopsis]|uniref:C2H2-type domain-containing protein n=1 Tax=Microdochium trichocladiopsis TaxID=1682393 RepID=A0A9P8Y2N7_9PEZI|nr:uncharacterized protein B0I36DRAFT_146973 [Microdochium trichocladiopsis]KAH7028080.1 hypothetical protein B0I36DRAFT_146973 [Microdochium trichocladiopsis]
MDTARTRKGLLKRLEEARGLRARAPIAAQFEDCSQAVQRLSGSLMVLDSDSDVHRLARDCAIRLNVWGHGSGASSRALDYSLKECPGIRQHTLNLLNDLNQCVETATSEARLQNRYDAGTANSGYLEDGLPSSALEDDFDLQSDPTSYLEEAIDILRNLFKLLPTLQSPLGENRGFASNRDPFTYTEEEFQQVAMMMFPKMHKTLARRFGHGNWCRRRYIWRLSGGSQGSMAPGPLKQSSSVEISRLERHFRLHSEGINRDNEHSFALESDAGASTIISSPETVLTVLPIGKQDSVTTLTDDSQPSLLQAIPLPPPPVPLPTSKPFSCTYCLSELPLTLSTTHVDDQQWHAHVYRDLKPYICTFGDCFEPRRLYNTRSDWFQHELNFHRSAVEWACSACKTTYATSDAFNEHLRSAHPRLTGPMVQALLQHCKRYKVHSHYDQRCTVCDVMCATIDELETHLAAHQEAYAPATFFNKEVPADAEDNSNMIEEFIQGLPAPPKGQKEDVDDLGLGVLASLNLSPPAHHSESNPLDDGNWLTKSRSFPMGMGAEKDHTADWVERQTSHGAGPAEQGLPKRYENFVGRDADLDNIHAHLHLPGQICSVSGRGGIGKTGLAIEYLHKYKGEYSAVFWIEAETPGVAAESFGSILDNLDPAEKLVANEDARVFQTREYLTKTDRRWLIVFDNVSSWKSIARYVPRNLMRTQGSVLITTRTALFPLVHRYQNQHAIELQPWPPEHGRQFLMTSIHPKLKKHDVHAHEDFPYAEQVLKVVGGLPLAISMIVGYVKVSRTTLADFLEMWEEKEQQNRRKKRNVDIGETDIDSTIDSLWTIGIREVRMNSRRLLDIMSFLDPERIQKALLVGDHQEDYLEWIHVSEALSFKRMIAEILGRRLISVKEGSSGPVYSIHRLLQQKILLDMEDYGFVDAFRKVFRLIRKKFPAADPQQVPGARNWDTCKEYIPHVVTLHRIFLQSKDSLTSLSDPTPVEISSLFYDAGFYLWARQSTSYDGLAFLGTAESILQTAGVNFVPKMQADIHCMMGMLLLNMGVMERREGMHRLKAALDIRQKVYDQAPTMNSDVLLQNAANDYALCLLNEHKFEEAGALFLQCRERYLVWGPEDKNPFENSKYYGNYALVYMWRNQMDLAIQFQKRSIELIERFSGRTNSYWRKVFMLACILMQNDDSQGALNLFMEVLTARLDMLGQHHGETILAVYAVGATYSHMGDPYTAINASTGSNGRSGITRRWQERNTSWLKSTDL